MRYGADADTNGWQLDITGTLGEWAYAKASGLFWPGGEQEHRGGDVAHVQVRATTRRDGGLLIRPGDDDACLYVLVCGTPPTFLIAGGMVGRDAKQDQYRLHRDDGRPPCWIVPQESLRPVDDLIVDDAAVRG
jgi:hypothetical protein